jgi:hypothetical protein
MAVSTNTKNVLEEMRRNGVDATVLASLERELDSKPAAEKGVADSLLAQASFNTYRTNKDNEIKELKENLTKLSSLQGAASGLTGDLQAAALEQIAALEKLFEAQGYNLEEVRAEASKLVSDPNAIKSLVDDKNKEPKENKEAPVTIDNKDYVDKKTFADILTTSANNLAAGGIDMSIHIARALREADKLGVELSDEKLNGFYPALVKALESNKAPSQAIDEYFGFSAIRTTKADEARKAELEQARQEGAQEALKSAGVTIRKTASNNKHNPNLVLSRKRIEPVSDVKEVNSVEDLPKNSKGDPEYYRLRRHDVFNRRQAHTENAVNRFAEVAEEYDDDGRFIGNRG